MSPKVSIVIPSYNAEKYLPNLIKCVLSQDEINWECILVDDGSKDNTFFICDEACKTDGRISVVHQENQGLSGARNSGIKAAKGEWIAFLDADDLITSTYLSSLLSAINGKDEIDLVHGSYCVVESVHTPILLYENKTYIGQEELNYALSNTKILQRCCAWARLYRRSIIIDNNIWYNREVATEDRMFNYEYLCYVRGIATSATIGYIYGSFSPTTLKHKKHSIESYLLRQRELLRLSEILCNKYTIENYGEFIMWKNMITHLKETVDSVYYHKGNNKESRALQEKIVAECYNDERHTKLVDNTQYKRYFESDKKLNMMHSRMFNKYNRTICFEDAVLSFLIFASRLLHKNTKANDYNTAIIHLN